jgi:Ca2+-binding RTX toxin-like protein
MDDITVGAPSAIIHGDNADISLSYYQSKSIPEWPYDHYFDRLYGISSIDAVALGFVGDMNDIIDCQVTDFIIILGGPGDDSIGVNQYFNPEHASALIIGDDSHIVFTNEMQPKLHTIEASALVNGNTYNDYLVVKGAAATIIIGGDGSDVIESAATIQDYICGDSCAIQFDLECSLSVVGLPKIMISTTSTFAGDDIISGGNGPSLIIAGSGSDNILGNGGDDILIGDWYVLQISLAY